MRRKGRRWSASRGPRCSVGLLLIGSLRLTPSEPERSVVEEPALGMKLTGDPHPLDRLVTVQPNTVAVVFEQDSAATAQVSWRVPDARPASVAAPGPGAGRQYRSRRA